MTDAEPRKPRFALFVATAAGLGYLPKAPGTWGSLGGLVLALIPYFVVAQLFRFGLFVGYFDIGRREVDSILFAQYVLAVLMMAIGVVTAGRTATYWGQKDPQKVVIDEVSGQQLALLVGCALPLIHRNPDELWRDYPLGAVSLHSAIGWKYLLVGFILFRLFDIWKPFPARQAESLPGGWGIMADDWVAGIYAALGLWIARMLGL
jgi:phosphatidylglycerophosphatase A